jgi:hypothetical protein
MEQQELLVGVPLPHIRLLMENGSNLDQPGTETWGQVRSTPYSAAPIDLTLIFVMYRPFLTESEDASLRTGKLTHAEFRTSAKTSRPDDRPMALRASS